MDKWLIAIAARLRASHGWRDWLLLALGAALFVTVCEEGLPPALTPERQLLEDFVERNDPAVACQWLRETQSDDEETRRLIRETIVRNCLTP
jgi:hypothetical protein